MARKKVFSIGKALADGLEETIVSAQNYSGELRVEVIALKKIEIDPDNPRDLAISMEDVKNGISTSDLQRERKLQELTSLQSIAHSISSQGIINPIVVYKHKEQYRIVAGERRTLASILAGKMDIQAKILDNKPDDLKISLLQWVENIERSDLLLGERMRNLEKIIHAYSDKKQIASLITVTEMSHLLGCSKAQAVNYRAVFEANDEIKKLIMENKIKNLEKAALLAGIKSLELRQEAIKECLRGATLKQLKTLITHASIKPSSLNSSLSKTEKRGRQTTKINFGTTKNIEVAKVILDSILKNPILTPFNERFKTIDWSCHRTISDIFKHLLKTLEKLQP